VIFICADRKTQLITNAITNIGPRPRRFARLVHEIYDVKI